jgi:AcrR family transcriptional regulator
VKSRRRLTPDDRRHELIDVGAQLFAARPYDAVLMEDVAEQAGVSRALLYRYFSSKRDLFAAIYQRAAVDLLAATAVNVGVPMAQQVAAGLDAHIDYFLAHRNTVLAANRVLAGDPMIQAIISDELAELRRRMLDAFALDGPPRQVASAALNAWLVFVRALCVEWLENESFSRSELRDVCLGALQGALASITPSPAF